MTWRAGRPSWSLGSATAVRGHRRTSRWGWAIGPILLLVPLLASCGSEQPSVQTITQRSAGVMAHVSFRISGSAKAGVTTTTFVVATLPDGDFAGSVVTTVPGSPTLSLQVTAVAGKVYVLSPLGLQQLGITSLPGNLNPATTWVQQTPTLASRYLQSIAPFTGSGIGSTLREYLKAPLTLHSSSLGSNRVWLVEEGPASSSLRLYIAKGNYHLLQLTVTGRSPISLRYYDFDRIPAIDPPPAADVYVPPATSSGT